MKRMMIGAVALSLPLMLGTAIADESPDRLLGTDTVPMSDLDLGAVNGGRRGYSDYCFFCGNFANVGQANVSILSARVRQSNRSSVRQSIN